MGAEETYWHRCEVPGLGAPDARERGVFDGYGPAFEYCFGADDGTLWITNSEYSSRVRFCPICGCEARKKES